MFRPVSWEDRVAVAIIREDRGLDDDDDVVARGAVRAGEGAAFELLFLQLDRMDDFDEEPQCPWLDDDDVV